jgi:uncharacterized protein (TIGR03437 family)
VNPGASIVVPIVFASQVSSLSAIQFDLQYDNSAMSLVATMGDAARASGKSIYPTDLAPNKKRFLLLGLNRDSIPDGTLINLFVIVNAAASAGVYPLKLSNLIGTDLRPQSTTATAVDGTITVQGTVNQAIRLQPAGVLNAASLLPGPVAPGEIVTLLGSGIGPRIAQQPAGSPSSTILGGTSVQFDGTPAPLLYAGPNQINTVVPFGVAGNSSAQMQITSQGQTVASLVLAVSATAPAIFTADGSGAGAGAILNQDSTANSPSNPAEKGSVVSLFATGAGQTDPAGVDGQIAGTVLSKPALPVSVQIDGLDARVLYAGAAPGLIAGLLQINCVVPANAPSGYSLPVVLTIGQTSSPAGVTLAIR